MIYIRPYVYSVTNNVTGQFYFGSRYKNVSCGRTPSDDFWIHYFTSSNKIKELIITYGKESFSHNIILIDVDYDICYWTEQDLIKKNINNPLCLNLHYVDKLLGTKFSTAGNKEVGKKISDHRKRTPLTPGQAENLQNMSRNHIGKSYEEISGIEKGKTRREKASVNRKLQLQNSPVHGSNNPNSKTYIAINSDGIEYEINGGMGKFCKEHNLNWVWLSESQRVDWISIKDGTYPTNYLLQRSDTRGHSAPILL